MVLRTNLVVQWLRNHLAVQGTPFQSLVQEAPTLQGAAEPACPTTEAHLPTADSPRAREATATRSPHTATRLAPLTIRESPHAALKTSAAKNK